jgi:hypothetical protein
MTPRLTLILCLALSGCADVDRRQQTAPAPTPPSPPPSASAIRSEFESICDSIRESRDPFYGELRSRELQERLSGSFADSAEEASVRALLGREMLKLDRTKDAIELLTRAVEQGVEVGIDPRLVLDMKVYLGLAHLQAAEDQNCLLHHSAASCILPVAEAGIHRLPEHSRKAGDVFLQIANQFPRAMQSLWLLNVARMVSGDYPDQVPSSFRLPADALRSKIPFQRWRDRAPELGTAVVDLAGGAVMDDFDGDGLLDLVTSTWDPCGSLKAFRNAGTAGFVDVTRAWGLDEQWGGLNLIHADFDNDGRLDLLVLRGAWMGSLGRIRNSLLRNELVDGGGRFVDVSREAGIADPAYPTQTAAWADYDGDGDLDLYVGNEDPDGQSYPSQLFRNNGDRTFSEVSQAAGVTNFRFAKAVTWGDYDDDGDPDLYVSNIGPNRLYRNNGDGSFTDVAVELGVTEPEGRSFASWFWDVDNDGDLDLFVADYESPVPAVAAYYFGTRVVDNRPRLYLNSEGHFAEAGEAFGLGLPMLPMGANFGDLDNDGWLDFYLGTGEPGYETVMPNVMFRNHLGRRFDDVTFPGGFGHLQKGHGVAFGDVDNDGDQDLLHQLGGFFPGDSYANALFENPTRGASWITLRLDGRRSNSFGVGARIEVRVRDGDLVRSVHALAGTGGTFGGSSLQQEIGLGGAEAIEAILIRWPGSGTIQEFAGIEPNRVYRATEGESELIPVELPRLQLGGSQQGAPLS